MNDELRKLCIYYISGEDKETYEKLKKESPEKDKEAKGLVEKLKEITKKFGCGCDFESFCNLLEKYINVKDDLEDSEKENYLKVLMTLSKIYEINLREELENYVSYKEKDDHQKKEIFYKFCHYNIKPNNSIKEFNDLKELAKKNNLDFKEIYKESIIFVEDTKIIAETLGFDIETDSFDKILNVYLDKKAKLNDYEKTKYLKVLLYLSEIYQINLRERLKNMPKKPLEFPNITSIFRNLTNPLENVEIIKKYILNRYHQGYFDIREIKPKNKIENKDYNYNDILANLSFQVLKIFLDKLNNYAYDDLNPYYIDLIKGEDISILENLKEKDLKDLINHFDKHTSKDEIIKEQHLTENIYIFLENLINETLDFNKEHIGTKTNSFFNTIDEPYTIRIYLNGELETIYEILSKYIIKCIKNNINYDMKATANTFDGEGIILFANINDILDKINILNEIIDEETKENLIDPVYSSSRIKNSPYGISHSGLRDKENYCIKSFNDYFNSVSEVAYYRILAKIIQNAIQNETDKIILINFISLQNVEFQSTRNPETAKYNGIEFIKIKDLINQNIPLVTKTIDIYMNEKIDKIIKEFQKSVTYISNLVEEREKNEKSLITVSSYIENYLDD